MIMVSIKEIKRLTYKAHKNPLGNYVERPLSYYLIKLLIPLKVTGNQVSIFSMFLFLIPFFLLTTGERSLAIAATAILLFISFLDTVDGGLARYYNNKTLKGKYLEYMSHEVYIPLFFFALSIYSFRYFNNYYILILGGITVFSIFLTNVSASNKDRIILLTSYKKGNLISKVKKNNSSKPKNRLNDMIFYLLFIVNSYGNIFYLCFFLSLFGLLQYVFFFYSALYISIAAIKFVNEIRKGFSEYDV